MATVDFFTGFTYKWAQTGNTFAWDDAQYKLGWATVGDTPPTVEQFNRVHQVADEKSNWLYGQLASAAAAKGITLSAGDLDSLKDILEAFTPAASEGVAGIAEIATQAEVTTGTDDARIITPLKLATAIPAASTTAVGRLRLATAAEAQAFSNNTVGISPASLAFAFQAANQSLVANGYQKLPGGLIVQWGTAASAVSTTTSVPFPISFPTNALAVVVCGLNVNGNYQAYVTLNSFTTAGAQVNCFNAPGGSPPVLSNAVNGVNVRFIAIGN